MWPRRRGMTCYWAPAWMLQWRVQSIFRGRAISMKFGVYVPNIDEYGYPSQLLSLAVLAEVSGWDGFFIWDDIGGNIPIPVCDPWTMLGAIASQTSRLVIGPLVVPLSRRRPWKVAREAVTLDHLCGVRVVLGIGLGGSINMDFAPFGEITNDRERAQRLDEGAAIIDLLWGELPVSFSGKHFSVNTEVPFLPRPIQQPRIPIWVACRWPGQSPLIKGPYRRAARWDGVCPLRQDTDFTAQLSLQSYVELQDTIKQYRTATTPFDVVHLGLSQGLDPAADRALVTNYAEVGVTWWLEHFYPGRTSIEAVENRIKQGPPHV